jgi:tRNA-splicing ligase RtcB
MASGKAIRQLGTSGSGNHFVEFGVLEVPYRLENVPPGIYVALMSHSGSRGTGAAVCKKYSDIAKELHPELAGDELTRNLGWLDLDTDAGREYWAAMNLMGDYAAANHDCIHTALSEYIGLKPLMQIENHHNFAWKETHNGREVIVHRKGATPAGPGVLGVIPGSMGTPAYVVRGLGNEASLHSASHGAGRVMSRKQANKTFNYREEIDKLAARGVHVISAGADEVCGVYKNIDDVMAAQDDLVERVARFSPKIVKMCGSGDRAED